MNQSSKVYDMKSALESLEPWLEAHLPNLAAGARRHFVQLVTGIVEHQSLLVKAIAAASPFQAEPESNVVQVQRIIRDTRLNLENVYYPLLVQLLEALPAEHLYITLDQTNQGKLFNLVLVGVATDGVSLPLGFVVYPTDGSWAEEARCLLKRIEQLVPEGRTLTLLADRVHAGDPFLNCLDELDWGDGIRLAENTCIEDEGEGWVEVRHLRQRRDRLRVFRDVRIWKGSSRRTTVCLYRHCTPEGKTTTWYLVTNLEGEQIRFVEYACRWWQECTHKLLKSAMFDWEKGRVKLAERVEILLMGFGCACWALWLLGRQHERRAKRKPTTSRNQKRRQNVIKRGWEILNAARKKRSMPTLPPPPPPRVLNYQRFFPGFRLPTDALMAELW